MAAAQIVPNAAFHWSSQLPPSGCCDDQLSSPWLPWSVLKISGRPYLANASSTASRQNSTSRVIDNRQARTRRLNQSITAAR
jgi:hypothetical protein